MTNKYDYPAELQRLREFIKDKYNDDIIQMSFDEFNGFMLPAFSRLIEHQAKMIEERDAKLDEFIKQENGNRDRNENKSETLYRMHSYASATLRDLKNKLAAISEG